MNSSKGPAGTTKKELDNGRDFIANEDAATTAASGGLGMNVEESILVGQLAENVCDISDIDCRDAVMTAGDILSLEEGSSNRVAGNGHVTLTSSSLPRDYTLTEEDEKYVSNFGRQI